MIRIVGAEMHHRMVVPWYEQAVNSKIARFLRIVPWIDSEMPPADGYNRILYMDRGATTLLSLNVERHAKVCGVALWSLPGSQSSVGTALRYLARKAVNDHNLHTFDYTFAISGVNVEWLDMVHNALTIGVMHNCRWGVEPRGCYDMELGEWQCLHQFRIPCKSVETVLFMNRWRHVK